MADLSAIADLRLVLHDVELFAFAVFDDRAFHLRALEAWHADLDAVAVSDEENVIKDDLLGRGELFHGKRLAFLHDVLLSSGADDGEHGHNLSRILK